MQPSVDNPQPADNITANSIYRIGVSCLVYWVKVLPQDPRGVKGFGPPTFKRRAWEKYARNLYNQLNQLKK